MRTTEKRKSERRSVMERISVEFVPEQHHRTRKRANFLMVLHTRELDQSAQETKQTATWKAVGWIVWQGGTDQTVRPIARSLEGWSGEATDRSKPFDNVPTLESGIATVRKRCICEHNAETGLGLVVRSDYTNACKRRKSRRA